VVLACAPQGPGIGSHPLAESPLLAFVSTAWPESDRPPLGGRGAAGSHSESLQPALGKMSGFDRLVGGCLAHRSTQVTVTQVTGRHGGFGQSWPSPLCGSAIRGSVRTFASTYRRLWRSGFFSRTSPPAPAPGGVPPVVGATHGDLSSARAPTPPGAAQAAQHWSMSSEWRTRWHPW
jgi:hypothetical protein